MSTTISGVANSYEQVTDMRTRRYLLAGAATVALAGGSVAAIAASGVPVHSNAYGMDEFAATSCAAPSSLPGQRVTVILGDMAGNGRMMRGNSGMLRGNGGMMGGTSSGATMMDGRTMMLHVAPQTVGAGTVSIVAVNHGSRTHELVVLPLAGGAAAGTRPVGPDHAVSEAGRLGEASDNCGSGTGDGIRSGAASWVTVALKPGRYELICNRPGHYAAGMYAELDIR